MGVHPGPDGRTVRQNLRSTSRSVSGPRYAVATQQIVVIAMVVRSATCVLNTTPRVFSSRKPIETANELIIETISDHALTRHQNQRTRYKRHVPAPTCRITSKMSFAVS